MEGDGWHVIELRNRPEKNLQSSGYKLAFQSLTVDTTLQVSQIDYLYDGISRLLEADYNAGATVYNYGYDVAGNLVNNDGVSRTYNAANQMTNDGTNTLSYDDNGNLLDDGVNSYVWDRANRLQSVGNTSYKYDGAGNRIQQTVSSIVTDYLNDVQPSLVKLLAQTTGSDTQRYIHTPRGIFAMEDASGWDYTLQDGLGSVRNDGMSYEPYGKPMGSYGEGFGFTGEYTDTNDLLYLRARYYAPEMALFTAIDPWKGIVQRPMSLNGYSWVEGNPINMIDPSGQRMRKDCIGPFDDLQPDPVAQNWSYSFGFGNTFLSFAAMLNSGFCMGNDEADSKDTAPEEYDVHIALGLAGFAIEEREAPRLRGFTANLNEEYQRLQRYPTVVMDRMWGRTKCFRGDTLTTEPDFPEKFYQGTSNPRVAQMHFNLEGTRDRWESLGDPDPTTSLREFAYYNGNKGSADYGPSGERIQVEDRTVTFLVTAWELANVSNDPRLCGMTDFYEQGTTRIDNPNGDLKREICNWNLLSGVANISPGSSVNTTGPIGVIRVMA